MVNSEPIELSQGLARWQNKLGEYSFPSPCPVRRMDFPSLFINSLFMTTDIDPFLLDAEQLQILASDAVIQQGLADFRQQCVTELVRDERGLYAEVEDDELGMLSLTLALDEPSGLTSQCACLPADSDSGICRHAVAALHAWSANAGDELLGAVDSAIAERVKRGRSEVKVTPLAKGAGFGSWRAQSVTPGNHFSRAYKVHIRSRSRRANYCTCPDFASNQLGTCKHIEAVLHRLAKQSPRTRTAREEDLCWVYLDWDTSQAPRIALHRMAKPSDDLAPLLDEWFDASGTFRGRLPDDFFYFVEQAEAHDEIDVGEDALGWVRHQSAQATHQIRAQEIRQRIKAGGGHVAGVQARLYPYQLEGVAFLAANGRALLADDMGLGKTLQAIAAARWLYDQADARRILVVCPASLKHQWAREIERFTGLQAQVIQGGPDARGVQYRRGEGFFIANYELILRDLSVINEVLCPDLLVLDEAQRIKNWRTKIASAVKLIPSRYVFVLTGTPLENRLEDLYSLMQVVDPSVLGPLWRYLVDFHVTDERGKVLGYRNLSELRRRLKPVMLRRDRSLVRDQLPERIQQRLDVPMTDRQLELHGAAMSAAGKLAQMARHRPLTPSESNRLMSALQQARMACNAAGLVDKETEGAPKLDELDELLEELCVQGGRKAVVFSQWKIMTNMVEQRVRKLGLGFVSLHGGVPVAKRAELMDQFRDDDAVQVFISTDAGGVGLNLQSATVLVNLDIPWNPAVLEQRIARIHRLGQRESVQVILMVAVDGYEARVYSMVQGKQNLFDNVVDPEASEDVVGVSPKLLEQVTNDLIDDSVPNSAADSDEQQVVDEAIELIDADDQPVLDTVADDEPAVSDPLQAGIQQAIEDLQARFGSRVERILGSGGGVLTVLDRVETVDDQFVEQLAMQLSQTQGLDLPLAVIDPLTLRSLQRLGKASPLQQTETLFDPAAASAIEAMAEPRLLRLAREKLEAASVLIEHPSAQVSGHAALELISSALLVVAAERAGLTQAVDVREAGVWLYAEAVPKGWLDAEQAALVMRAVAMEQAEQIPLELMRRLLDEASQFLAVAS